MNEQELHERVAIAVEPLVAAGLGPLFSAALVEIRHRGVSIYSGAFGDSEPGIRVTADTLFDLDRLTELFTTAAFLSLVEDGRIWIDTPVEIVLEDAHADLNFYHLLTHTSGLPETLDLYRYSDYDSRLNAVMTAKPDQAPGSAVRYSPLDFILLGLAIEALLNLPLEQAIAALILQPLDLRAQFAPISKLTPVAMTHSRTDRKPVNAAARSLENVAGHAGLFGTAADVAAVAQVFLQGDEDHLHIVSDLLACEAVRAHNERFAFGWQLAGNARICAGGIGTWACIEPESGLLIALLTNRVYSGGDSRALEDLQAAVHRTAADLVSAD